MLYFRDGQTNASFWEFEVLTWTRPFEVSGFHWSVWISRKGAFFYFSESWTYRRGFNRDFCSLSFGPLKTRICGDLRLCGHFVISTQRVRSSLAGTHWGPSVRVCRLNGITDFAVNWRRLDSQRNISKLQFLFCFFFCCNGLCLPRMIIIFPSIWVFVLAMLLFSVLGLHTTRPLTTCTIPNLMFSTPLPLRPWVRF